MRFLIFGVGLLLILSKLYDSTADIFDDKMESEQYDVPISTSVSDRYYLPKGGQGEIIHHKHYSLSYREEHEQAEWVAYELTRASLKAPNVKRAKKFKPDYSVSTRSAFHRDYTGSGYTRGHMAPAGDMAFETDAMQESFYMSNMSPQLRTVNNGIWKELEEQVRDWAFHEGRVYVVTGPMLNRDCIKRLGKNKVSVPSAFYKIILDIDKPDQKAIAFIIPHEMSVRPLQDYVVSIDALEQELGVDMFADLLSSEVQSKVEPVSDISQWKFSQKRFELRRDKWNYQ